MKAEKFTIRKGGSLSRIFVFLTALLRDKDLDITVAEHRGRRSDQQNRLLWSLYGDILERGGETMGGWTKDDLHELFLGLHFGWEVIEGFGQRRKKPMRRSSKLNTVEFTDFIEFILRYMAEQGVYMEMPGEIAA